MGRVVFCGDFELIDCCASLQDKSVEVGGCAVDAVGIIGLDEGADEVHARVS